MERDATRHDLVDEIFRIAHTLKSSAAFVGLEHLAQAGHHMEDLLQQIREGARALDAAITNILFRCLDRISATVHQVADGQPANDTFADLIAEIKLTTESAEGRLPASGRSTQDASQGQATVQPIASGTGLPKQDPAPDPGDSLSALHLNPEEERALAGLLRGRTAFNGRVILDRDAPMKHIRFMLLLENLKKLGELFRSVPSEADLDSGAAANSMEFIFLTESRQADLLRACHVDMVQEAIVAPRSSGATTEGAIQRATEETRVQTKNIKVSADKIDYLMNNVGEMVITNSGLQKIYEDLITDLGEDVALSELKNRIDGAARIARDLQTGIMKMRMIPVGLVFHRFTRPVRDLSAELGKEVDLVFHGDDTELDKNIIDVLPDSLLHLLRNSLDHGIETPAERARAGKSERATITMSAYQGGNNIFIEVRDDGRGLDAAKILDRAKTRGLVGADYRPNSEDEVFDLVFQPGFSTADHVSDLSGRGVGMNVVKTMVQKFNGSIRIRNEVNEGCAFVLSFPLTLAIISAILIRLGEEEYAIPLSDIVENVRIKRDEITTLEGREICNLRGEILPIHELCTILGQGPRSLSPEVPVVVASIDDRKHGFVVSGFAGKKEIVIKSLEQNYRTIRGLIGVCLMGDGRIVPVLDMQGVLDLSFGDGDSTMVASNVSAVDEYNRTVRAAEDARAVGARSSSRLRGLTQHTRPGRGHRDAHPPTAPGAPATALLDRAGPEAHEGPPELPGHTIPRTSDGGFGSDPRGGDAHPGTDTPEAGPDDELSAALARLREDRDERRAEGRALVSAGDDLPDEIGRESFDKLYEIINAGMMNAGLVLSQLLGISIEVSVPEAHVVEPKQLSEYIPAFRVISVWLDGQGDLELDLMLVFDERNGYAAAGELMGLPAEQWNADNISTGDLESVLSELTNIVGSSIFNALANRSGLDSQPSVPAFTHSSSQELVAQFLALHEKKDYRIIYISTDFYRAEMELVGRLFLFLPKRSIGLISERL